MRNESPKFVIDVLAVWFDRVVKRFDDGEETTFFSSCEQNQSHLGAMHICEAALKEPAYFVDIMLPKAVKLILQTELIHTDRIQNRAWPWLSNNSDPSSVSDAILFALRSSFQTLATHQVDIFRQHALTIVGYPHETFAYLLLSAWPKNPVLFADDCVQYLIADQRRLNIGYGDWVGSSEGHGKSAISRVALREVSPHCDGILFHQLEDKIIGYRDEYEEMTPHRKGFAELLVLRSLDRSRISDITRSRIQELEQRFPQATDVIPEEEFSSSFQAVESPIELTTLVKMTDEEWISAMQKYDGTTDRFQGGPEELSQALAALVRKDRHRYTELVVKMPDTINPIYFSAILDALFGRFGNPNGEEGTSDNADITSFPTDEFLKVIEKLHSLPNRPCGSSIVCCVEQLSSRKLPDRALDIVSHYAIFDPDPTNDIWKEVANGRTRYFNGDPLSHGINTVRGQAALSISALLFADNSRIKRLQEALAALSNDKTISVRVCAIRAILPLLNFDQDEGINLFVQTCQDRVELCATSPFDRFVYFAIRDNYPRLHDLLRSALFSSDQKAVEIAAKRIILAELVGVEVKSDAEVIRTHTNQTMRKAAADVYARNISNESVGDQCATFLEQYLNDPSDDVRQEVSSGFFQMSGDRLFELKDFIAKYIESPCFETDPTHLLGSLEKSNAKLPEVIQRAAKKILDLCTKSEKLPTKETRLSLEKLSTLVVRQYEQTTDPALKTDCLDLIDQLELQNSYTISQELAKLDR